MIAPLRSSDRRKLKQRVTADFGLQPEEGELLVPEGLLSQKISTHLNEPGVIILFSPSRHSLIALSRLSTYHRKGTRCGSRLAMAPMEH